MDRDFHASENDLRRLVEAQATIIELLAPNVPFEEFLIRICELYDRQMPGSSVSILLPTEDGTALIAGLGLDFGATIEESDRLIPIAEGSGTSGTAAFRRETVITTDLTTDPLWTHWRQGALAEGMRAVWSSPLIGSDDQLLGVLAVIWPQPATPSPDQEWLMGQFTRISALVIERYRHQQSVSQLLADERRAIAQDLHDDPIQAVTAASLQVQRLLNSASPDQRAQLIEIQGALADAVARMRSMLFELHPPTLDDEGLASAVELYLYERIDPLGIAWELHDHLDTEPTPATASLAYRLTREALSNVAHHSRARHTDVTLESGDNGIHVRVVDDGVGCDIEQALHGRAGHLGTVSSRHLARRASGRWRIESAPGKGTTVEFWIPTGHFS